MHIPDGYLSPATCAVGYAVAVPMLAVSSRRVTEVVKTRNVPMLAVLSAVSFLIMMFNVPIPDGTTAHAVGGAMIAVCLGPWAACIAVSVALLFQALLFGDGGVLAYGVNVVNMAVILPFVAIGVYRLISGRQPLDSRRRILAAGVAGYVGLTAAALATGIELGIQPGLFTDASGAPMYSPYNLSQAVPAMLFAHLTVASFAEAIVAAGVFAYLQRADISALVPNHPTIPVTRDGSQPRRSRLSPTSVALGFVAAMIVLTPLGLLAPGGAFGEDAPEDLDLGSLGLSAIPEGLEQYNSFWSHTVLRDYGFGDGDSPVLGYLVSAVVGIAVVGAAIFLIGKLVAVLTRREAAAPAQSGASRHSA
ncbi:MAG: cobalt transporter CbiM [Dermatophilaceae bacterium]